MLTLLHCYIATLLNYQDTKKDNKRERKRKDNVSSGVGRGIMTQKIKGY